MKKYTFFLFAFFCLQLNAQTNISNAKKEISESALILNNKLPIKVDAFTTAIIVKYNYESNELTYYFRVNDFNNSELNQQTLDAFFEKAKDSAIKFIRNSPNNKAYLIAQLDFIYVYVDSKNELIYKYRITPNDYNY
jgi:hypothetical protein